MSEEKKTVKQVCKCENCGNEAEMEVTCTMESIEAAKAAPPAADKKDHQAGKAHGTGVCTHCGNEADMWIDV
ncbi:MAG: hypothetical protein GY859_28905 [Desulfobacterales bacterium]|nr:hypothetical protein [Desulfobacterales bacterium]